jgi:anti-sigma regulatory factor (Ser/Thr protein kinase)
VVETHAAAGVVYLIQQDRALQAVAIGGEPPTIFTMPDRVPLDATLASAVAFRTGSLCIAGESAPDAREERLSRAVPYSHSAASAPLHSRGRSFGALTVTRCPARDGPLDRAGRKRLSQAGECLANELYRLEQRGVAVLSRSRPLVIPLFADHAPRRGESDLGRSRQVTWGIPTVPGSSALTFMYHVHKLAAALNQVVSADDLVEAVHARVMAPFGTGAVTVSVTGEGRWWVVGHSGRRAEASRHLHGSSVAAPTPETDVLAASRPLFFDDRDALLAAYPQAPDDGSSAWAVLPLASSGRPVGTCTLSFDAPHAFNVDEQVVLMMMARLLGPTLERVRLGEQERMLAESLQKRLLPRILSDLPEVITTARYLPAPATAGIGGDWYDVITLPDGSIGLVVGDVEGHSIDSSVMMGQLRSAVRAYAAEGHDPAGILRRSSQLLAEVDTELLATCCFVRLDVTAGTAEVALAGHPAPLIRWPDGRITSVEASPGVPLGVQADWPYHVSEVTIPAGTVFLLYTDGLTDSLGLPNTAQSLLASSIAAAQPDDWNLEGLADRLIGLASRVSERRDDVAVLLARYEGARLGQRRRISGMKIQRHDLAGVKAARTFIRDILHEWGLTAITGDVILMVSEIVTNGLIHADSDVDLRLREYPDHIRLEVRDADPTPPIPSVIAADDEEIQESEHGRGLIIVDSIASRWGSSPSGRGKTVWLEMQT